MQPGLVVKVLPLKPQILLDFIDRQLLNRSPRLISRLPNDLALAIGQLERRTDLIGMEVIKLLLLPFSLIDLRQWRLDQVAPRIVAILLIPPLPDTVVLDLVELAGIEVQPVGCGVVAEFLAADQRAGITTAQLAVGFLVVLDLAA